MAQEMLHESADVLSADAQDLHLLDERRFL